MYNDKFPCCQLTCNFYDTSFFLHNWKKSTLKNSAALGFHRFLSFSVSLIALPDLKKIETSIIQKNDNESVQAQVLILSLL